MRFPPLTSGCEWRNSDTSNRAENADFYHLLWFWDGYDLPVGLFRQKLFSLDAAVARLRAGLASYPHADCCPYGYGYHDKCEGIRLNSSPLNFCGKRGRELGEVPSPFASPCRARDDLSRGERLEAFVRRVGQLRRTNVPDHATSSRPSPKKCYLCCRSEVLPTSPVAKRERKLGGRGNWKRKPSLPLTTAEKLERLWVFLFFVDKIDLRGISRAAGSLTGRCLWRMPLPGDSGLRS